MLTQCTVVNGATRSRAQIAAAWVRPWANVTEMAREAGLELDERQRAVAEETGRRVLVNCSRQWGKSTVAALRGLWTALEGDDALVLVAAPGQRQALMVVRTIRMLARRLGLKVKGDGDNPGSVVLPNGGRVVPIPGNEERVRGFSRVALMIIDEASRTRDPLYFALLPMLAVSGGQLLILSTPGERKGFFYREWVFGEGWCKTKVTAWDCGRIDRAFLEEQKKRMPKGFFGNEFECEFAEGARQVFPAGLVERWMRGERPTGDTR